MDANNQDILRDVDRNLHQRRKQVKFIQHEDRNLHLLRIKRNEEPSLLFPI